MEVDADDGGGEGGFLSRPLSLPVTCKNPPVVLSAFHIFPVEEAAQLHGLKLKSWFLLFDFSFVFHGPGFFTGFYICDPCLPLSYQESVTGVCQGEALRRAWWEGPAAGVATACPCPATFSSPHFSGPQSCFHLRDEGSNRKGWRKCFLLSHPDRAPGLFSPSCHLT